MTSFSFPSDFLELELEPPVYDITQDSDDTYISNDDDNGLSNDEYDDNINNNGVKYTYNVTRMLPLAPANGIEKYHINIIKEYICKILHINIKNKDDIYDDDANHDNIIPNIDIPIIKPTLLGDKSLNTKTNWLNQTQNILFTPQINDKLTKNDKIIHSWLLSLNMDKDWKNTFQHQNFLDNFATTLQRGIILIAILFSLNVKINSNYVELEPIDESNKETNINTVKLALLNMGLDISSSFNYDDIYYKLIQYDSLKFLNKQDNKIKDKDMLNDCYNNNNVGILNNNEFIWEYVLCYLCGEYAYETESCNAPYIDIREYKNRLDTWFNKKLNKINDDNNENITNDVKIHHVLRSLKLPQIEEIFKKYNIDYVFNINHTNIQTQQANMKIMVQILNDLNITKFDIHHSILLTEQKWFDIIKANIMCYAAQYSFNHDNWV